jgi:hypothetical protein
MDTIIVLSAVVWALLFGQPVTRPAQPDPVSVSGLHFVNLSQVGSDTHFRYELRSAGAPAVSNVEIALCASRLIDVIIETPDDTAVEVRSGLIKIETPRMGDKETKIVTLIMSGTGWSAVPTTYTLKAGQIIVTGATYGPQCTPTAVTLSGLSADVDGVQARDIVLLVLIACIVLLVRQAFMEGKR